MLTERRIFSDSDLDQLECTLIMYADMGWPLGYKELQSMMAKMAGKTIDPATGTPYRVSRSYVCKFVKSRNALAVLKTSNIDPLRAKKATLQVLSIAAPVLCTQPHLVLVIPSPRDSSDRLGRNGFLGLRLVFSNSLVNNIKLNFGIENTYGGTPST